MIETKPFQLVGGHVALDFVNTLDYPNDPERSEESICGYGDLLAFAEATGLFEIAQRQALQKSVNEAEQAKATRTAMKVRENLRELFSATAQDRALPTLVLDEFNDFLAQALRRRRLQADGKTVQWAWEDQAADAAAPLWRIVFLAAELLASPQRELVRQCANGSCGWLFLDTSKNHSRRWCEMKTCGNRVKARNHYQRVRAGVEDQS